MRKEFCSWLLEVCPVLQEYGNISYKLPTEASRFNSADHTIEAHKIGTILFKKGLLPEDSPRTVVPVVSIDTPD